MTSNYTARNRLLKQGAGDNTNTWGDLQSSQDFDMIDEALDGWATVPLTGNLSLSSANGTSDQARMRMLKFTGAGAYTVTLPAVSKAYAIWNALSGVLTVSNGSASVTLQTGEKVWVANDGSTNIARVQPTDFGGAAITSVADPTNAQDVATKHYVDAQSFAAASGNLPGQAGSAGKFLQTDGTTPGWGYAVTAGAGLASVTGNTVTVSGAAASDVRGGSDTAHAVTAGALMASSAFQTLTDAAAIAWNCAGGYNARITLTGTGHKIGNPTGLYDGMTVSLDIVQGGSGSYTVTWDTLWDFGAGGNPILQTAVGKRDRVFAQYNADSGKLEASFRKGA